MTKKFSKHSGILGFFQLLDDCNYAQALNNLLSCIKNQLAITKNELVFYLHLGTRPVSTFKLNCSDFGVGFLAANYGSDSTLTVCIGECLPPSIVLFVIIKAIIIMSFFRFLFIIKVVNIMMRSHKFASFWHSFTVRKHRSSFSSSAVVMFVWPSLLYIKLSSYCFLIRKYY